ncbi:MAG: undecaprenyl-diphosphate phosphatase, partial [Halobacteriovoraceae bacterium]|nr:undecaprenyl-diphosphate phosphatase [Halobacteriovoraceae bacterium]
MEASYTIIYGLVQGVTEFLPVSSSGHLALIPHFLKISDPGVAFDLAMHLGTALSICCYFYKEIKELLWQTFNIFQLKYKEFPYALNMMVATLTTFLVALGIKGIAEVYGRGPKMIAANLIVFGVLMF